MNEIDMNEVRRKVYRASTEHGVFDLVLGLFLLFYSYQLGWAFAYGLGQPGREKILGPIFVALVFVIFPAAMKRRLAARSGYFKATHEPGWVLVVLVLVPLILLPFYMAVGLKLAPHALRVVQVLPWLPMVYGVVLGVLFWVLLRAGGEGIYKAYMVLGLLAGVIFTVLGFSSPVHGLVGLFATVGVAEIPHGVVKLVRFTRRYPVEGGSNGNALQ